MEEPDGLAGLKSTDHLSDEEVMVRFKRDLARKIRELSGSSGAKAESILDARTEELEEAMKLFMRKETKRKADMQQKLSEGTIIGDPAQELISQEEWIMAKRLGNLCDSTGKEMEAYLNQTAEILCKMGEIYLEKAEKKTKEMLQKLSFIRSCALLHGAKVRFLMQNNDRGREIAENILQKFSRILLRTIANQGNKKKTTNLFDVKETNLFAISDTIARKVELLRETFEGKIRNITRIPETNRLLINVSMSVEDFFIRVNAGTLINGSSEDIKSIELEKIKQVMTINEKVTENYKELMREIAENCTKILGKPPCKFALVGLGSMAREEITLYSDFESVIILEDNVEMEDDEKVREYFQWFTVLFQCIIIGLGETFIKSVGIKSISDLYSGVPSRNWFCDVYTPSGISFDGMVPHSCNTPLGRQEPTKLKKHIVELIQPAKKMAEYLTSKENLKNGYYLKDLLARTCYVHGNEDVYQEFESHSRDVLQRWTKEEKAKQCEDHMNHMFSLKSMTPDMVEDSPRINSKMKIYRPITACLFYMGSALEIKEKTTFAIIDKLGSMKVIDEVYSHYLKLALALACEVRIKSYKSKNGQRVELTRDDLYDMIGQESVGIMQTICLHWFCTTHVQFLGTPEQTISSQLLEKSFFNLNFAHSYQPTLIFLQMNLEAIQLGKLMIKYHYLRAPSKDPYDNQVAMMNMFALRNVVKIAKQNGEPEKKYLNEFKSTLKQMEFPDQNWVKLWGLIEILQFISPETQEWNEYFEEASAKMIKSKKEHWVIENHQILC